MGRRVSGKQGRDRFKAYEGVSLGQETPSSSEWVAVNNYRINE